MEVGRRAECWAPGSLRGVSEVFRQAGPLPKEHSLQPVDLGRGLFLSGFSGDPRATSVPSPRQWL